MIEETSTVVRAGEDSKRVSAKPVMMKFLIVCIPKNVLINIVFGGKAELLKF